MDAFWLIPVGIVAAVFLGGLYAYIRKLPLSPSDPHVVVDKPSSEPSLDPALQGREWEERPCASYLAWSRSPNQAGGSTTPPK